jgi:hypothetical protein
VTVPVPLPAQETCDQLHGDEAAGDQSGGRAAVVLSQAVRKATSEEGPEPAAEEDAAKRRWSKRRGRGRRRRWRRRMGLGDGCNGKGSRMKRCAVFGGSARAVHNGSKHQARLLAALAGPGR